MSDIQLRPLMTFRPAADASTVHHVGTTPMGFARRVVFVSGGSFEGERLSGRVLPGGGDWLMRRPDGVLHLDVRCVLETREGELIYMTYKGRRKTAPEIEQRLLRGETVDAEEMYFRTLIEFEASASRLLWLNDIVAVGIGSRPAIGPTYQVFEIR